MFLQSVVLCLM